MKLPLTKQEWIERYGGAGQLEREGFVVVRCTPDCTDPICHGWRVVKPPRVVARYLELSAKIGQLQHGMQTEWCTTLIWRDLRLARAQRAELGLWQCSDEMMNRLQALGPVEGALAVVSAGGRWWPLGE